MWPPWRERQIEPVMSPSPVASQKAHATKEWIFLICPMLWAKQFQIWNQEESLHIHLDTAASGFEHGFENSKHCGLGSCFITKRGLSGFWDPGWV